jgi:hypothetical protein
MDRPFTYTDIYLAFNIPKPTRNKYKIETLSSHLISGYEVISLASNTIYKYALNDTDASIQTTLIYKKIGNFTKELSIEDISNDPNMIYFILKVLPIPLFDMYVIFRKLLITSFHFILFRVIFYILFFYVTVFLISERKDSFLSLLNISGLQ